jgi:alpha-ribazole phosphatase
MVLVRHAASKGSGSFLGQNDPPLNASGRRQLKYLVAKLSRFRFQVAFASDLMRSQVTALAALEPLDVELETRPGLREMHFGRWQGLSWEQITKRYPRLATLWLKRFPSQPVPGAERFVHFKKRVKTELHRIVAANQGRCVLVVTHAGVIRIALADALGITDRNMSRLAQDYCGVNVIDHFADGVTVRCVNG